MDINFDMIYVGEPSQEIELALQMAENRHFGNPAENSGSST